MLIVAAFLFPSSPHFSPLSAVHEENSAGSTGQDLLASAGEFPALTFWGVWRLTERSE